MNIQFLSVALLGISIFTNLTVEAIKKFKDKSNTQYSSNILAVIVSASLTIVSSVFYIVLNNIPFTMIVGVQIIVLIYLSFLVSTLGYDKVVQSIKQYMASKGE